MNVRTLHRLPLIDDFLWQDNMVTYNTRMTRICPPVFFLAGSLAISWLLRQVMFTL